MPTRLASLSFSSHVIQPVRFVFRQKATVSPLQGCRRPLCMGMADMGAARDAWT
jgi:hypothetical protein